MSTPNKNEPRPFTTDQVDVEQDTGERVWAEHLEYLRKQVVLKLRDFKALKSTMAVLKGQGDDLVRRAYGVMLYLGKTEEQATKELEKWRQSAESS